MQLLESEHLYISNLEKEKSTNYINIIDRNRYVIQRVLIRKVLSLKLQKEPNEIQFEYGVYGKPFVPNESLKFNISHSRQMLMIGFVKDLEIGVDIEFIDYNNNIDSIADSVLTKEELIVYKQKNKKDKIIYFYKIWTKKEAYSKTIGKGLSIKFNTLDIPQLYKMNVDFNFGIRGSFSWAYCIN